MLEGNDSHCGTRSGHASVNTNAGSSTQTSYNATQQSVNHGRDQVIGGQVINIGGDLVRTFTTVGSEGEFSTFLSADDDPAHSREAHKSLWDAIAGVGASHKAEQQYSRGECLQETRVRVLRLISDWNSSGGDVSPICWLSGAAGVGKTAIAMSIAKSCEEKGLLASFFFFRSDPKRNNPSALMLTIAHGLVVSTPSSRTLINGRIARDPTILEAKLEDQFRELVLTPVSGKGWWARIRRFWSRHISNGDKVPRLIVIDGLDECSEDETQLRILTTIASSFQSVPAAPLRFLICSRPEAWIREAFAASPLHQITKSIVLDDSFSPEEDIKLFFVHEFQNIRTSPKYARVVFPVPWPSPEELQLLVHNSSGQFIYSAIVVKFVKLAWSNPIDQLRIILNYTPQGQSSESPFPELDRLYHIVISANPDHEKLLSILAAIYLLPLHGLPPSPEFIEVLMGFSPGRIDQMLRAMHSVLEIRGSRDGIRPFHNSLNEYLSDRARSGMFYIDRPAQQRLLARQWLQALATDRIEKYSFDQLHKSQASLLFERWKDFCLPSIDQEMLEDLGNIDASALFLVGQALRTGQNRSDQYPPPLPHQRRRLEDPMRDFPVWDEIFTDISSWLRSS
ncbi:hypothetical protein V5O48_018736, partial [Marasmius crinis-equi]